MTSHILHFTVHNFPPYATKIITIRADFLLSDPPLPEEFRSAKPFLPSLHPEPYCESGDPDIIALAQHLKTEEPLNTAEQIFHWVSNNLEYVGYLKQPRGARYALTSKQGDCTEFMYLFMALCRAAGIPARGLGGYIVAQDTILRPADYHNWAEFYVDGAWRLADPQRKVLMQADAQYLAMHIMNPLSQNPMGHYSRFRSSGEGLEVKMQ